ncbi:hypothetical protein E2562_027341 [Oryza meyeriana var. granulata]|uniref:Uncharacterized protein n=1 Tax=Oryza meyeriana var. granulata TaxID=110450 RepID=A0A6G1E331_9ORYZ|nr:hypothetical protein E2562_027341 [Oryza meyeriana var. granulata]
MRKWRRGRLVSGARGRGAARKAVRERVVSLAGGVRSSAKKADWAEREGGKGQGHDGPAR